VNLAKYLKTLLNPVNTGKQEENNQGNAERKAETWCRKAKVDWQGVSRIRPGDRGKVGSGWLTRPLRQQAETRLKLEAEFTSSSGSVRALSVNANKELGGQERLETASNRVK
jgi:hypothetical protein